MTLAQWLIGLVGPVVAQVLLSLGISVVALSGATAALAALRSSLLGYVSGMTLQGVQLAGLLGIWEGVGIWFGAMTFVLSWHGAGSVLRLVRTAG